ncbi:hypothetical protein [Cycloclasticus pugetii]|uniref:hypothetical protein n=1 Tax=Cycloclasticus pugetii TaxID=34068 RepID=UPI0003747D35|nr:hypothetical protein [Cycloclasticus pugetii]
MDELNNPAGRLLAIIKEGGSHGKDEQCIKVWSTLLKVPLQETPVLLQRIGHVMSLPDRIAEAIYSISDVNHDIYLKWHSRVMAGVQMTNFQNPWKSFIDRFDAEIMYGIEICADTLSRSCPEKVIPQSTLNELLSKIAELQKEFSEHDLPPNLAQFICQQLEEIKQAINEYPYLGTKPLEAALEKSIGKIVVCPQIYKNCQKSTYGKKFWEFMGYLAISVTITTGAIQIGKDVVNLLPAKTAASTAEIEIEKPEVDSKASNETTSDSITIKT